MAQLKNTNINGNLRVNGSILTDSLNLNGTEVGVLSGNIAGNTNSSNLVTAAQVVAYIHANSGSYSASVSTSAGSARITNGNVSVSTSDTGFYVTLATSAGSATATATIGTAGWITKGSKNSSASSVSVNGNGTKYYIPAGTISTGTTNQTAYVQNTSAVVPAGGYLYIGAGYYNNTQISLATLIPDDGNYSNAGSAQILKNYEAYNTNGQKLIGTIDSITPSSTYYTSTNTGFGGLTGHRYINSETKYIIAGSYTSSLTGGDLTGGGTVSQTASLSLVDSGNNVGVTTNSFVDSKPTSGYYIGLTSSADGGSGTVKRAAATATANIGTAGWIAKDSKTSSLAEESKTVTVSAASSTKYLKIDTGNCTHSGGGLTKGTASGGGLSGGGLSGTTSLTPTVGISLSAQTTSGAAITDTKPTSGYYLTLGANSSSTSSTITRAKVDRAAFSQTVNRAAVTYTRTAGYITAETGTAIAADSSTVSLEAGSMAAASTTVTVNAGSKTRYVTIPEASITPSSVDITHSTSGIEFATENTDNLVPITCAVSAKGQAVITAGYTPATTLKSVATTKNFTQYINNINVPANKHITVTNAGSGTVIYANGGTNGWTYVSNDFKVNGTVNTVDFNSGTLNTARGTLTIKSLTGTLNVTACTGTLTLAGTTVANSSGLITTTLSQSGATISCGTGWITAQSKTISNLTITNNTTLASGASSSGTINGGSYIKISAGYNASDKYYQSQTLAAQTGVDSGKTAITAAVVRSGYQGWVNGTKITGTMGNAAGSVTMTKGSGAVSGSNVTLSTSNTSGISVTGSGSVSATAKITTAGYAATNNSFATGASTSSNGATKYITGVTLENNKSFTINDGINTWTISKDASGNVTIT